MARQIILVCLALAISAVHGTVVEDCGGTATLNAVEVQDCPDAVDGRCQFIKGRSYTVQVDAAAKAEATALPYTAKANILGVPITMFSGNACESLTAGNCPVENGERVVFAKAIDITNTYPALQSLLTVEVKDQTEKDNLLCAKIKFAIVNA